MNSVDDHKSKTACAVLFACNVFIISVLFMFGGFVSLAHGDDASSKIKFEWVKTFGDPDSSTSFSESVDHMAIDSSGILYLAGAFKHAVDFDPTANADNRMPVSDGLTDIYVSSFDSNGIYLGAKIIGGIKSDYPKAVNVDIHNNFYLAGIFSDAVDFDPSAEGVDLHTAITSPTGRAYDGFITKFNSDGTYDWTETPGAENGSQEPSKLFFDRNENMYMFGYFTGTVDFDPTQGDDTRTSPSGSYFISKWNADGSYGWTRTFMSSSAPQAVAVDSNGNVILSGVYTGTVNLDPTGGVDQRTSKGGYDIFVTKLNPDGSYAWSRDFGSDAPPAYPYFLTEVVNDLAVDDQGACFLTGYFTVPMDFDPFESVDMRYPNGDKDIFVTKINADGFYAWTKTIGGLSLDESSKITTDQSGNVYFTGFFYDTVDFDPTGSHDRKTSMPGNYYTDMFVTMLKNDGAYGWTYALGGAVDELPQAIKVNDRGDIYIAGTFYGTIDFDSGENEDVHTANGYDAFVLKLSPTTPPIPSPEPPVVTDSGQYTNKADQLYASWVSPDPSSNILEYQYMIIEDMSGEVIRDWTSVGTNTFVTVAGLNLWENTTFYFGIKARNIAGWSGPGYSDGITLDKTPPAGTFTINSGVSTTTNQTVTLTFNFSDTGSGMGPGAQMHIFNDRILDYPPVSYAPTKQWTLSSGYGKKTVYVKVKDAAGNWSPNWITKTITYGKLMPPVVQIRPPVLAPRLSTITTSQPAVPQSSASAKTQIPSSRELVA